MASRQTNPRIATGVTTALNHLLGHRCRQAVNGPAEYGNGHHRRTAHGINIADRISGSDAAKLEGVVDDWHKKICGANNTCAIAEVIDRGVVFGVVAHQKLGVIGGNKVGLQKGFQHAGRYLAAAASTVAVLCEADFSL